MTNLGRAKEAAAFANSTTVEITHIAIGDGATVPSGGETALYNQLALKTVSSHGTVAGADNVAYFDCFLTAEEGPYTIREAGLYDVDGDLIAIAHYDPPINKPVPDSGQTIEATVRLEVAFSNIANITISVDPSLQVALQRLTRLPWIPIISMSLATPPGSPVAGDTYVIASSPTGSWSGQAGKIAEYTTAGWAIITPPDGHGVSLPDGRVFERISGTYVEKLALDAQSGKWVYAADSGTANTLVVTLAPVPAAYTTGMALRIKANNTNTFAATLNVNSLGAKNIVRADGTSIMPGDIVAGAAQSYVYDGTNFQMPGANRKPELTVNTTFYVNTTTGHDTNYDGRSATVSGTAGPFKTIQKAIDAAFVYGPSNYMVNVQISDGSYAESVETPVIGGPAITITGNVGNPANVLWSSVGSCLTVKGPNSVIAQGFKFSQSAVSGAGMAAQGSGASLSTTATHSGVCAGYAFLATSGGSVFAGTHSFTAATAYCFTAVANGFLQLKGGSTFTFAVITVTSVAFAVSNGSIEVPASSVPVMSAATVTGKKYTITLNGVINTQGQSVNYFPGTVAGTTGTGGQYG
jgi:hypothetical protein